MHSMAWLDIQKSTTDVIILLLLLSFYILGPLNNECEGGATGRLLSVINIVSRLQTLEADQR